MKQPLKQCEYKDCTFLFRNWSNKKYCPEHTDLKRGYQQTLNPNVDVTISVKYD